jgi:hypothetical protein
MWANKDHIGGGKQTSELPPGELERRKLLAKLSEFVADSDLSIPRIAQLMGVSGGSLTAWISGTAKPQRNKLLEIRSFLDSHSP